MQHRTAQALARVGFLGNPSDGYGGRVIAFTMHDFMAKVSLATSQGIDIDGEAAESWPELIDNLSDLDGATALLVATVKRFAARCKLPAEALPPLELQVDSDIPLQSGLAGSSAIVIATLRAMMQHFDTAIQPTELADLALAVETEELGIAAGPQDRVIQAYEGLMDMDFSEPRSAASYRRLDPLILPPLYVAWNGAGGASSGDAHSNIRRRFEQGEAKVCAAMVRFAEICKDGLECLERGDHPRLRELLNENFDLRASIWSLSPCDLEMIRIGRNFDAGVKFCGSGGAVVGVLSDADDFPALRNAYREAGFGVLQPSLAVSNNQESAA